MVYSLISLNNMDIEKREEIIALFDTYGSLLTSKQQEYFALYYFDDYSLSEIAGNYEISRNAVFDLIKKAIKNLEKYEENLKVLAKSNSILEIINDDPHNEDMIKIRKIIEE